MEAPKVSIVIPTRNEEASIGRVLDQGGAALAGRDVIVTLDADLTYPADRIPEFVRLIEEEGADFVSGNRLAHLDEGVMSGMHRLGNRMLTTAARWLYRFPIQDSQSGMWG